MARDHKASNDPITGDSSTSSALNRELLAIHNRPSGSMFKTTALVLAGLFILGIIGFVMKIINSGPEDTASWGYHAAVFAFIITTASAAPMVAIAPRMVKAHWRRSISRAAELWAVVGVLSLILFLPLLAVLPSLADGRRTFWFYHPGEVPEFTPHIWTSLAILGLTVLGLALVWMSSLPDMALLRDNSSGWKQAMAKRLAFGWKGTSRQWFIQKHRLGILGAFYFMMLVFAHFMVVADFLMPLVPGWIDALFPATHAFNALQAGIATVLITMFFLRKYGGYHDYIGIEQFRGMGKLLLATSLLWVWFWFSSFNVLWYGKKPSEQAVLGLLMVGPYLPIFLASFVTVFIIPFVTMIWNPVRRSTWGPPLIAVSVLIGTLLDRVRLYVAAYSVPGIGDSKIDKHELHIEDLPSAVAPNASDVFIVVGAIAGAILIYMLVSRIIPVMNIWEQRELLLYKVHKPFHRTEVQILGKPD